MTQSVLPRAQWMVVAALVAAACSPALAQQAADSAATPAPAVLAASGSSGTPTAASSTSPLSGTRLPADVPVRRDRVEASSETGGLGQALAWSIGLLLAGAAVVVIARSRSSGRASPGLGRAPAGAGFWGRRWSTGGGAGPLRQTSQSLTAQASIHVVVWHGEELLLGCTPQGVSVLARHRVSPPEETPPCDA